jgi:hypothetical protein
MDIDMELGEERKQEFEGMIGNWSEKWMGIERGVEIAFSIY